MTETPVSRLIIRLGIPTTVSMLITSIYNMADTYFVGGLGESQQAATGILFTLQAIIQAVAFMLGHGSGSFVAKYLARKDTGESSKYVSTAFITGAVAGLIISISGFIFLEPLMRLLGSTETILPYAKDYGGWVLASCPFMICSLVLNNNLRYEGKALYAMIGLSTGGILNIFGDWLLIKRFEMGVYGAGMATAISQVISFTILVFMFKFNAQSTISFKYISKKPNTIFKIIKVGFPSLIRQGLSSVSNGLLNNLAKPYGDAAIAAISVVNRFSGFVMCVGLGIGQGFQPVSSFNYSAGKYKRVKHGLIFTTILVLAIVSVISVFSFIFADNIIYIFQKSEDVSEIGVPALRFSTVGLIFLSISLPVNMLYQSIQKAGTATFLSLLRSGLAFIPVLLILSFTLNLLGIELAQPVADVLTGLISLPFLIHFIKTTPDERPEQ